MINLRYKLKRIVAAGAVSVATSLAFAPGAIAQSSDLDGLFAELSEAAPEQARGIERRIIRLFGQSGSASADLLLERGRDAMEEGKTDVAIEHFTALTDHAPDFAEGFNMRATAYFRAGLFGPALADLERALALEPRHFGALFGMGVMMIELGYPDAARAAFDRVAAIHPHFEDLSSGLERLDQQSDEREL